MKDGGIKVYYDPAVAHVDMSPGDQLTPLPATGGLIVMQPTEDQHEKKK